MPDSLVDLLRLGFPGLAAYFLYLAYKLSKQLMSIPNTKETDPQIISEKRKALNLYGLLCLVALVLSVGAEVCKIVVKPPELWIRATALGQFTEEELKQRPLELSTWSANDPDKTFKYFHSHPIRT